MPMLAHYPFQIHALHHPSVTWDASTGGYLRSKTPTCTGYALEGGYYIFLDSTDPLEQLFGIIRDLHGPGTQVDCIQFEERATAAMSIAAIYSRHPEWQRGSRRLTGSLDHMNPRAWLL